MLVCLVYKSIKSRKFKELEEDQSSQEDSVHEKLFGGSCKGNKPTLEEEFQRSFTASFAQ